MYHGNPQERQRLRAEEMRLSTAHALSKSAKGKSNVAGEKPTIAFPIVSVIASCLALSPNLIILRETDHNHV